MNVDGIFSGHRFIDGSPSSCHPSLQEPFFQAQVGKDEGEGLSPPVFMLTIFIL